MTKQVRWLFFFLMVAFLSTAHSASTEDWFRHYYEHPTPDRLVAEVQVWSAAGKLSDPNFSVPIAVFVGRVMEANPTRVGAWLAQLGNLKGADRQTLLMAASWSGTREAQAYLDGQADAEKYRGTPADVRTLEPDGPNVLDMLWADFFATGEASPIRRIVAALNYEKYTGAIDRYAKSEKTGQDRQDAISEAVFKSAMWSLESNAKQQRRVGEDLEQIFFAGDLNRSEQLYLSIVLAKVLPEKYELTHAAAGQWIFKRKPPVPGVGWRDSEHQPLADTDAMKSRNDFAGSLLATTDEDWEKKWNTPAETTPSFNRAETIPYGKPIYILAFFVNPQLDALGEADVRCDIRITAPTGKVAMEQKDSSCFSGPIQGSPYAMRLSAQVVRFSGDPGDPAGSWAIEVTLRDRIRKVELPLRTSFELKQP